jgi:hypothetical protein
MWKQLYDEVCASVCHSILWKGLSQSCMLCNPPAVCLVVSRPCLTLPAASMLCDSFLLLFVVVPLPSGVTLLFVVVPLPSGVTLLFVVVPLPSGVTLLFVVVPLPSIVTLFVCRHTFAFCCYSFCLLS